MVDLNQVKSVAILGDINTGKTNLAVSMLREYKKKGGKREIYLVGYPKQIDDFKNISNFQDLFKLTDSVVFIDEIQKYIKIYDRKANYDLMELISLFAHNNNTLVFTTCFSQFISRSIEGYIDCWDLTRILDLKSLKNGGKAKRIIEQTTHPKCNKWSLALKKGEYLEYSELNDPGDNNVKEFEDQKIGKDWRVKQEKENCEQNPPEKMQITATKKIVQKKSLPETKGTAPAAKDLSDEEVKKLAWGGGKK